MSDWNVSVDDAVAIFTRRSMEGEGGSTSTYFKIEPHSIACLPWKMAKLNLLGLSYLAQSGTWLSSWILECHLMELTNE